MNIVDFYTRKAQIIKSIREDNLDRADAQIELDLLNAEAKAAELKVALLDVHAILNENFTGGFSFDTEEEYNDDESYEESESYDDDEW